MSEIQVLGGPLSMGQIVSLSPAEAAVAQSLMRCAARWGIKKTTIEDIAREAGVSRATVYRHFPGGTAAILETAWTIEVCGLMDRVWSEVSEAQTLEDALVRGVHLAASHLGQHPALAFMREHEPAEFEQLIAFDRLDEILVGSGEVMAPLLTRFMPLPIAFDTVMWAARLLVSYLSEPAEYLDITVESDVRLLVSMFLIPGVEQMTGAPPVIDISPRAVAANAATNRSLTTQALN